MFVRALAASAVFSAVAVGSAFAAPVLASPSSPSTTRPTTATTRPATTTTTQRRSSTTSSGTTATTRTPTTAATHRSTPSTAAVTRYRVTVKSRTSALNLRPEPGTAKAPLDHLISGTIVQATGKTAKVNNVLWREVTLGHETGWVNGTYLSPVKP